MVVMQKLSQRFTPVAFAFFMAVMMGCLMSFTIVAVQTGVSFGYLGRVLHTYASAVPVAFLSILLVRPLVARMVSFTVEQPNLKNQPRTFFRKLPNRFTSVVFSFYMAALMDLLMCCAIVALQAGLGDSYWNSVIKAYMFGMPVAFCSVVVVRPIAVKLVSMTVQQHNGR